MNGKKSDLDEYFMKATGGNNRKWAKRYEKMITKHQLLKDIGAPAELIKGYEICMETFTQKMEIKHNEKPIVIHYGFETNYCNGKSTDSRLTNIKRINCLICKEEIAKVKNL